MHQFHKPRIIRTTPGSTRPASARHSARRLRSRTPRTAVHLQASRPIRLRVKPAALNRCFAGEKQLPANAAPLPLWMDEKARTLAASCAGSSSTSSPGPLAVATIDRAPLAPSATGDHVALMFHDEVSPVANQLPIHAEYRPKRGIQLRGGVKTRERLPNGQSISVSRAGISSSRARRS